MQVKTQPFKEALEIKNDGMIFDIYGNGAKRLGDLCVTKTGLVWSKGPNGKAQRHDGINVKWEEFITWVQSRKAAAKNGSPAKVAFKNGSSAKLSSQHGKPAKPAASKLGQSKGSTKPASSATVKKPVTSGAKAAPAAGKKAN